MDIFKLLARSTNLSTSGISGPRISQNIPSAGAYSEASNDGHGVIPSGQATEGNHRDKKRRLRDSKAYDTDVPDDLNLLGSQGRWETSITQGEHAERIEPKEKDEIDAATDIRLNDEVTVLSGQERKTILSRHKIKVTVIGEAKNAQNELDGDEEKKSKAWKPNGGFNRQVWPLPLTSFKELRRRYRISTRLADNLDAQGYSEPTEVQLGALPALLGSNEDRGIARVGSEPRRQPSECVVDLLTVAPTGSGKTLAYLIPVLQGLVDIRRTATLRQGDVNSGHHVQAIILAPTHELVDQIVNEARKLAKGTGIKIGGMKKGMRVQAPFPPQTPNAQEISSDEPFIKADILISTPHMMLHATTPDSESEPTPLPLVRYLVLDEADVLLDPLFREDTLSIWSKCSNSLLQTTLWSATIGSSIESLAQTFLASRRSSSELYGPPPSDHYILRLVVGLKDSAIPSVAHHLTYTASERGKLLALRQLLHPSPTNDARPILLQPPFLIFTQTIPRAIALHSEIRYDIPPEAGGASRIAVLHADLSSTARSATMASIRKGEIWIVITTDLLARGVDIRGLNGVVNYDIPTTGASYVHRVGRTGRQGREGGVAVTLYTKEDIPYVKNIANVIAASERVKRKANPGSPASSANGKRKEDSEPAGGIQKWLLDALPRVSKQTKQQLKRKGVESRRPTAGKEDREKARISTKSGFDRRMEDRRRGAKLASRRRQQQQHIRAGDADSDGAGEGTNGTETAADEWGGFDE